MNLQTVLLIFVVVYMTNCYHMSIMRGLVAFLKLVGLFSPYAHLLFISLTCIFLLLIAESGAQDCAVYDPSSPEADLELGETISRPSSDRFSFSRIYSQGYASPASATNTSKSCCTIS